MVLRGSIAKGGWIVRIGYPCINRSIGCRAGSTFRLASYSEERLERAVRNNLECLYRILEFNVENGILFFRITSDLIPFASHPDCRSPWQRRFADAFSCIAEFIRRHRIRISMHPDQFVLLNSMNTAVQERSKRGLAYHAQVLEALELPTDAKVQLHLGGVYGDRRRSIERFIRRYEALPDQIRSRLVIENDDRLYTLADCVSVHDRTGVPVLLDVFHHRVNGSGESCGEAVRLAGATWAAEDGVPMVDYSSQQAGRRAGVHAESIDLADFRRFLAVSRPVDIDIMLEIKDKERSAIQAVEATASDPRFIRVSTSSVT
ncbi:MAG: UV DNA damage repair endonuclease UvsE [Methanomicrobiales archaeon]|nr:UV DNA damage repair endonuclease UvsE [Methanomicrobiales archaeon]